MPKKTPDQDEAATVQAVEEVLLPFNVVIDGQDRTIFATDQEDLQIRIAKIRGSALIPPLKDGQ
jgi:hypothetical protein